MTGRLESGSDSRRRPPELPSDRSFGFVFVGLFLLVGLWSLWKQDSPWWWSFGVSGALALIAMIYPGALHPLNRLWMGFGGLLHRAVSPVILAGLYFGLFTPMGWFMRLIGKAPLQAEETAPDSYWVLRDPPGPDPDSLRHPY